MNCPEPAPSVSPLRHPMAAHATNEHVLHGVGSVNQTMGGAGIATAIDAIDSNYDKVSSLSFLKRSAIGPGVELFMPDRSYTGEAALPTGGFVSGTVDSKTREAVIPSFGLTDYHAFQNSASGPFLSNGAALALNQPVPGTRITQRLSEDSVSASSCTGFNRLPDVVVLACGVGWRWR